MSKGKFSFQVPLYCQHCGARAISLAGTDYFCPHHLMAPLVAEAARHLRGGPLPVVKVRLVDVALDTFG